MGGQKSYQSIGPGLLATGLYETWPFSTPTRFAFVGILLADFYAFNFSGEDSCNGDSGGPLLSQGSGDFKSTKYLVGIVSFGTGNCGIVSA